MNPMDEVKAAEDARIFGLADPDVESMTTEQLADEVRKLRAGIRADHAKAGHDLCWHKTELWSLVPGLLSPRPHVPPRREFLRRCEMYRDTLDPPVPDGPQLVAVMGMAEMESAVSRIIEKRVRLGIDLLCQVTVTWEDMRSASERDGFLNLLLLGWLEPNFVNCSAHGEFFPNERLVGRLSEKLGPQPWLSWRPQVELKTVKASSVSDLDYSPVDDGCRLVRRYSPGAPLGKGGDVFYLSCAIGTLDSMSADDIKAMIRGGWIWSSNPSWVDPDYDSGGRWTLRSPELVRGYYG